MPRSQLAVHGCGKLVAGRRALVRNDGSINSATGRTEIDADRSTSLDGKPTPYRQVIHTHRRPRNRRQTPAAARVTHADLAVIDSCRASLSYCCYPNQNIRVKEPRSPRPAKLGRQPRRKGLR